MHLAHYPGLLDRAERTLADALREVSDHHRDEVDVLNMCRKLAAECDGYAERLHLFVARYGEEADHEPERLHASLFDGVRSGPLALLRDLQDLYLLAAECDVTWTLVGQAAQALRDDDLLAVVREGEAGTATQLAWLRTRLKAAGPQALVVA